MSHVINSRALTGEKPCIKKAIHALLMHGYGSSICSYRGHIIAAVTRCVLPCPRTIIVRGNSVRATSVKVKQNSARKKTRNVANVFSFYAIIAIEHGFSMHLHSPGPLGGVENRGLPCLIPILHLNWTEWNLSAKWAWAQQFLQDCTCAQTQISMHIFAGTLWLAKDPKSHEADSRDTDQGMRMLRLIWLFARCRYNPVGVLYKSTAGRYRPVSNPDGPITARCRLIKNAYWEYCRKCCAPVHIDVMLYYARPCICLYPLH